MVPAAPEPGSFKDPSGRVYRVGERILRGLDECAAGTVRALLREPFFQHLVARRDVVASAWLGAEDAAARSVLADGWNAVVEHPPVPFLTWPYEWPFSMLKDAALLQLRLLTASVKNGWTCKDATPFNVQYTVADGAPRPLFIDVPSFEPRRDEAYWRGYRQFCATFLAPLMLAAHSDIPSAPLLRASPEGVPPEHALRYFRGLGLLRRGVPTHIWFPARAERALRRRRPPAGAQAGGTRQPARRLLALLDNLTRLVRGLSCRAPRSDWTDYAQSHSYDSADLARKEAFVRRHAQALRPDLTWDLGANTGGFSRIAAPFSKTVVAVDADHDAVEALYRSLREAQGDGEDRKEGKEGGAAGNILPLVMDVANPSPGLGWASRERAAFDARAKPDLVLCLALIHHLRVAANVPLPLVLDWLRALDAAVLIEFVGRDDEMFAQLLANRRERYEDYSAMRFEAHLRGRFAVRDRLALKGGNRELFLLAPV